MLPQLTGDRLFITDGGLETTLIARAAEAVGVPSVISYTVETDGRLPSGQALREAIEEVDADTRPAYFMINCAHPTHFADVLAEHGELHERLPSVCVLGGCCGTDARHVREVATAWAR
jgi:S-methylmethionine-dependent homocysteine/selenocysteine methylase